MITIDKAKELTTARLLAYYKKHGHDWETKLYQDLTDINSRRDFTKLYIETEQYWKSIKKLLDKREHVETK